MIEHNGVVCWSSTHDTTFLHRMVHDQVTRHNVDEQGMMTLQENN